MPNIEIPDEIADHLADLIGIYGGHDDETDDPKNCWCRVCFVPEMAERIRRAVANERLLQAYDERQMGRVERWQVAKNKTGVGLLRRY